MRELLVTNVEILNHDQVTTTMPEQEGIKNREREAKICTILKIYCFLTLQFEATLELMATDNYFGSLRLELRSNVTLHIFPPNQCEDYGPQQI
ncbi:hypothetical protein TNCV_159851 [Trichonephila clavipes]|uniref:Uncharacterized protein n=1 Tax=Trichonephila clavipes TaxID=2585209 RepID=A0A8X6UQ86_TRICX|nr:hypothetical protein TNCV_159851 [Trichonephila clavipes]